MILLPEPTTGVSLGILLSEMARDLNDLHRTAREQEAEALKTQAAHQLGYLALM